MRTPPCRAGGWLGGTEQGHTFNADRMSGGDVPKLSFYRNRAYDQTTGRWTQEDPIGVAGGLNLYQFNGNNPVAYTDPFGLCTKEERGNATQSDVCGSDIRGRRSSSKPNRWAEAGFLVDPFLAIPAFGTSMMAIDRAPAMAAQHRSDDVENATEAARHQLWQCITTQTHGEEYARALGDAHEAGSERTFDSHRDQYNNAAGRALGNTVARGSCGQGVSNNLRRHNYSRLEDFQY